MREWFLGLDVLNPVVMVTLLVFAATGGWIGWRRGTRAIYRRSLSEPLLAPGVTRRDFDRQLRQRRKMWRVVWTIVYALSGALIGLLIVAAIPRR